MKPRTPFLLYLLVFFFFLAALVHLMGSIQAVQSWNWLLAAGFQPHPVYIVFKSVFLFLAYTASAVFLLLRYAWTPLFSGIVILINTVWLWVDRLVLTQNPLPFRNHLFQLAATLLLLFFFLFSLYLLQPYMHSEKSDVNLNPSGDNDE